MAVQAEESLLGGCGIERGAEESDDGSAGGDAIATFFAHGTAVFGGDLRALVVFDSD